MLNIDKNTSTAGAYVLYSGYFLFMFGFAKDNKDNHLGVVRLGGHREQGETAIQCAVREVKEESSLDIVFYNNKYIYVENGNSEYEKITGNQENNPIFVRGRESNLSIMYLAYGRGVLLPNMETQGVLLLRREDIEIICSREITFKEYKENGGKFILAKALPDEGILSPHIQLQFLNQLFTLENGLMTDFMKSEPTV